MKSIHVQVPVVVDGLVYQVQVVLAAPDDTQRDLDKVRAEVVRLLPGWVKAKIEKG